MTILDVGGEMRYVHLINFAFSFEVDENLSMYLFTKDNEDVNKNHFRAEMLSTSEIL